jgi:hypothetical protein
MSDLRLIEFRERAEGGLDVPELAEIERRGRALRRRRLAAGVGGLALVLLAGAGIARMGTEPGDAAPDPAAPPSPAPSTSFDHGVRTTVDLAEEVLLPGRSEARYDGLAMSFDVTGRSWEWWDGGVGLRRSAVEPDEYAAAVFFLPQPSARLRPCYEDRAQPLGADPERLVANAAPLLDLAHATVIQEPRVVSAFGGTAVHLRVRTDGACPAGAALPVQLRGVVGGAPFDSAWPGRHEVDLWHVVVPGADPTSLLVASWDMDGTAVQREQQRVLLDSLRINAR